jgi:hypothetical protein
MTAFTIFVLLLTFGYLVYFAVMITLELHKKEEVQKSDEEVFDVSDMAEQEEPTCIEEHINNEENGVLTYTDELTDDGIRILNPTSGIQQSSNVHPEMHETTDEPDNDELNEEFNENMEIIDSQAQVSLVSKDFYGHLNDMHKKREMKMENVIDHV